MNEDAMEMLAKNNGDILKDKGVMIYCDPTYLPVGAAIERGKNPGKKTRISGRKNSMRSL